MTVSGLALSGALLAAAAGTTGAPPGEAAANPAPGRVLSQQSANAILGALQKVVKDPLAVTRVDVMKTVASVHVCKEEDLDDCVEVELSDGRDGCDAEIIGVFCARPDGDLPPVVREGLERVDESVWVTLPARTAPPAVPDPGPEEGEQGDDPSPGEVTPPTSGEEGDEVSKPRGRRIPGGTGILIGVLAVVGFGIFRVLRR